MSLAPTSRTFAVPCTTTHFRAAGDDNMGNSLWASAGNDDTVLVDKGDDDLLSGGMPVMT